MKKTIAIPALLILWAVAALGLTLLPVKNQFALKWDYTNDVRIDPTFCFVIYTSADLSNPITNWSVYTNVSGSNSWTAEMESNNVVYAVSNVSAQLSQQYWFVTASNFFGESLPSNTVTSPPALFPILTNSTRLLRQ